MDKNKFDELITSIDEVTAVMLDELKDVNASHDKAIDELFIKGFNNYKEVVLAYKKEILMLENSREMYYCFTKTGSLLKYSFPLDTCIKYDGVPLSLKEAYDKLATEEHVLTIEFFNYDSGSVMHFKVGKSRTIYEVPITTDIAKFERESRHGPQLCCGDISRRYLKSGVPGAKYVLQFMKILASPDFETLIQMAILGIKKYYLEEIEKAKAKGRAEL